MSDDAFKNKDDLDVSVLSPLEVENVLLKLEPSKRRQIAINSKRKGNAWESKVCKILTKRFGENRPFSRQAGSGGLVKMKQLDAKAVRVLSSDIICPDGFIWSPECKAGYDIDLLSLYRHKSRAGRKSDIDLIDGFMNQSIIDANISDRRPWVIYKKDNRPPISIFRSTDVFLNKEFVNRVQEDLDFTFMRWRKFAIISFEQTLEFSDSFFFLEPPHESTS